MKSSELITLVDENRIVEVENKDKLRDFLNIQPFKQWLKKHPFAKDVDYLPIDKVEVLLDAIFQDWRVEVKSVSQLAQSICAIVRLHYKNPVTGEWTFHDGVGATPLKTKKGCAASDLASILNDAVATGAPAAVSFAIKDAADHIGRIFGRDLNRKDTISLKGFYNQEDKSAESVAVNMAIGNLEGAYTLGELKEEWDKLTPELKMREDIKAKKDEMKAKLTKGAHEGSKD